MPDDDEPTMSVRSLKTLRDRLDEGAQRRRREAADLARAEREASGE